MTKSKTIKLAIHQAIMWSNSVLDSYRNMHGELSPEFSKEINEERKRINAFRKLHEEWFGTQRTSVEMIEQSLIDETKSVTVDDLLQQDEEEQ